MSGRIYCFASFGSVQKRTTPSSSSSPPPPSLHAPHSRAHKHVSSVYFETEWKKKKKKERGKEGTDLYLHYLTSRSFFHLFSSLLFLFFRSFSRRKKNLSPPSFPPPPPPSLPPSLPLCGGFTGRTNRRTTQSPQTGGTVCFYVHVKVSTYLPTYVVRKVPINKRSIHTSPPFFR